MINYKKGKLIKKHLGENTPKWVIDNCIALLNEYEEIELDKYIQAKNNDISDIVIPSFFTCCKNIANATEMCKEQCEDCKMVYVG